MYLSLIFKSLWNRKLTTILTILSLALSFSLLVGIEKLRKSVRGSFSNTISGADLVVGGRTSPVQLLLYSIFHIGNPTNNVSYETYKDISSSPIVDWTVPISLGDSHRGYRVIGTTDDFFKRYQHHGQKPLVFAKGKSFQKIFEVVIGSEVAKKLHYKLDQKITLSHGISSGPLFEHHEDHPFTIVGVLRSSGTPVDRSVMTSLEAITAIHKDKDEVSHSNKEDLTPKTITAFIARAKTRFDTLQLQRDINEYKQEALTGVIPGVGLSELWQSLHYIEKAFFILTIFIVIITLFNMLISIYTSLENRRREMAIFRSVGAKPLHIGSLYLVESIILTVSGIFAGLILLYGGLLVLHPVLLDQFGIYIPVEAPGTIELLYALLLLGAGILLGLVPFIKSYRMTLTDGLEIKI